MQSAHPFVTIRRCRMLYPLSRSMTIRRFKEEDRESLQNLYLEVRKQTFSWLDPDSIKPEDFDKDTEGESIWVCEIESEIIGFASAQALEKYIHHLYVLPQHTNHGYGSQLLEACLNWIAYPAQLKCLSENTTAIKFYRSRGWRTVSKAQSVDGEYQLMETIKK